MPVIPLLFLRGNLTPEMSAAMDCRGLIRFMGFIVLVFLILSEACMADGTVSLHKGERPVWTPDTGGKRVSAIELQDSGNLVLLGNDSSVIWQSFSHPTNTLISDQEFREGMKLVSDPSANNLTYVLEIKSGDMILSAGFRTPQPYWSMQNDNDKTINKAGGQSLWHLSMQIHGDSMTVMKCSCGNLSLQMRKMRMLPGLQLLKMMASFLSTTLMMEVVLRRQKYQVIRAAGQNLVMHILFVLVTMFANALQLLVPAQIASQVLYLRVMVQRALQRLMMEEGKVREILDSELNLDENDKRVSTAIKVALWCAQEDMHLRPPMPKVVQMLEGLCPVPQPPISSPLGFRLHSSLFKSISEEGTSSGPSDCNSDAYLSSVQLSGPR
ncbi:hypothetical protein GH714_043376 [Hevea brasiliensis]|uniref:Bulb-type lectin domain-containing protein n=1 Tax=Hevea brasiliensis TaxID=3981 RepID=A0A6A6K313_HEVBR|nr:hypothetical protein GH714_043376 [Hevea brasiliensis]